MAETATAATETAETSTSKKPQFKCDKCSKTFSGGRSLGTHYKQNPKHRPKGKRKATKGGRRAVVKVAAVGFNAQLSELAESLDTEIRDTKAILKLLEAKKKKLAKLL